MFKNLVNEFLKLDLKSIRTDFDDNLFNGPKFKLKGKPFEEDCLFHHKDNPKSRYLCSKCNSTIKHDTFINDE